LFQLLSPRKILGRQGDAGRRRLSGGKSGNTLTDFAANTAWNRGIIISLLAAIFRLDEMQAAISFRWKLPHLANWSAARRAAADFLPR